MFWWWGENCVTCGHPLGPWRIICVWFRVPNKKSKTFGAFEDWLSLGTLTKNYCGRFVGCAKKHNWYWSGWEISKENQWMVANLSCKNFLRRGGQGERGYNWEQVLETKKKKKNQNCETFLHYVTIIKLIHPHATNKTFSFTTNYPKLNFKSPKNQGHASTYPNYFLKLSIHRILQVVVGSIPTKPCIMLYLYYATQLE